MTTIASDGITVAADSLTTVQDMRTPTPEKKLRLQGGYLFGLTGETCMFDTLIEWYLGGKNPAKFPTAKLTYKFIVFRPDKAECYDDDGPYADMRNYPVCFGSGTHVARGALLQGATPYEAVKCACKVDVYSAEPITTHTIPPLPKQKRATKTGRTRRSK